MKKFYMLIVVLMTTMLVNAPQVSAQSGTADVIQIEINNNNTAFCSYDEYFGTCDIQVSTDTYQVCLAIKATAIENGKKYTLSDFDCDSHTVIGSWTTGDYDFDSIDYIQTDKGNGVISVECNMVATESGLKYHIYGDFSTKVLKGDEDADFTATFTDSQYEIEVEDNEEDNVTMVTVGAINGSNVAAIQFVCPLKFKSDYPVPIGTYEINGTKAANTVVASEGEIDGDYTPSAVGILLYNSFLTKIRCMTSGTVTVSETATGAQVVAAAKNSWGKNVNVTINLKKNGTSSIATVAADDKAAARKIVENGEIVIVKGDKKYNVLGIEIK